MRDSYRGESPSKKFMRIQYWLSLVNEVGGLDPFRRKKHLVLTSREAGDISLLLGLGVPSANIVAVDHSYAAIIEAQRRFPSVTYFHGDVLDVVSRLGARVDTAFLDYCAPIKPGVIIKTLQVASLGLQPDGFLGCAFMSGREKYKNKRIGELQGLRNFVRNSAEDMEKRGGTAQEVLSSFFDEFVGGYLGEYPFECSFKELLSFSSGISRYIFLEHMFRKYRRFLPKQECKGKAVFLYRSDTKTKGTPMTVFLGKMSPECSTGTPPEIRFIQAGEEDVEGFSSWVSRFVGKAAAKKLLNLRAP